MFFFRTKKISNLKIDQNTHFDQLELNLLKCLVDEESNEKEYVSVLLVNDILNIQSKSPENQRRIRTKFLNDINLKFRLNYNISEAVTRYKSEEDNRLVLYRLKDEAKIHIKKLLS